MTTKTLNNHVQDIIDVAPLFLNAPVQISEEGPTFLVLSTRAPQEAIERFRRYLISIGSPVTLFSHAHTGSFALVYGALRG